MTEAQDYKKLYDQERKSRLEAERALVETHKLYITTTRRLENLITSLKEGVLVEDEHRRIILVNQQFCELFGVPVPPEMMIGQDCSQSAELSKGLFRNPEEFIKNIEILLLEKKAVTGEILELQDGRFFQRDFLPVYSDEVFLGHMWKYSDITDRKRNELELVYNEEKYRGIIANMNLGLLEVDTSETILYFNQSFLDMSGWGADELRGKKPSDIFLIGDNVKLMLEKNTLRKKGISDVYEVELKDKQGRTRWWMVSGAPLYDKSGELKGSIGIHLDITKQKELELGLTLANQRALESSQAKDLFLMNMSHELRTPMNGIIGFVRELRRITTDNISLKYLASIQAAAEHLLNILNDILDLSRIDAGKLTIDKIGFKLSEVVARTMEVISPKSDEKGLLLTWEIDERIYGVLKGDPIRLKQIFLNLLGNSIKFTEKGKVSLNCKLVEETRGKQIICFEVEDSGIGMEKEFFSRMFSKFSQEDSSITRNYGGTGLGLNICKELIDMMKGAITVDTEKGRGTKFTFILPFEKGIDSDIPEDMVRPLISQGVSGVKVLLVEDNALNQEVARLTLHHLKAEVDVAGDGEEALEMLQKNEYDIVLMDLQMPKIDGYETTIRVRNQLKSNIPIVALTANAIKGEREKCLECGMNDFVSKPFDEADILRVLVKYVECKKEVEIPSTRLYDLTKLHQLAHGDGSFVKKMLNLFILQCDQSIMEFNAAREAMDLESIKRTAHRIKPSVGNLRIDVLFQLLKSFEEISADSSIDDELFIKISEVIDLLERVKLQIRIELE